MTGPGKRGIYAWPGFEMYALAGAFAGAVNVPVPLAADGRPDIAGLVAAARHPDARVLAVCNPHNPTGTYLTHREFLELLDGVPDQVLVINDEAYAEFAEGPASPRLTVESTRRPNLVTLRTFSKIYGLAGLRAGYAITSPSVIDLLRRAHTPFAISRPAEAGSVAALHEADEVARRAEMNRRERGRLLIELRRRGFSCLPSQANFVFALPPWQGPWLELLLRRGVLVRPFEAALRITIGLPEHHEVLLAALRLRRGGSIVTFSSSAVALDVPGQAVYNACKAGVEVMTTLLAKELRGRDITVNAVAPGPTETQLFLRGKSKEAIDRLAEQVPLGRIGRPADIASLVAFLVGHRGRWVNGQTIRANGGLV